MAVFSVTPQSHNTRQVGRKRCGEGPGEGAGMERGAGGGGGGEVCVCEEELSRHSQTGYIAKDIVSIFLGFSMKHQEYLSREVNIFLYFYIIFPIFIYLFLELNPRIGNVLTLLAIAGLIVEICGNGGV